MTKNNYTQTTYVKDSPQRVSTQEIDDAVQQLESAYTEGRLDDNELEQRMDKALAAKTEADLYTLLADLARVEQMRSREPTKSLRRLENSSFALFSGIEHKGSFILPKSYRLKAIFGGCVLDLRTAHLESPESTITISAIFGGIQIFVPSGVRVEVNSTPIFGGVSNQVREDNLPLDAPVIRINVKAIFGGVEIKNADF